MRNQTITPRGATLAAGLLYHTQRLMDAIFVDLAAARGEVNRAIKEGDMTDMEKRLSRVRVLERERDRVMHRLEGMRDLAQTLSLHLENP